MIVPFSGMLRAQGREMGVIECWYTRADKLPKTEEEESKRKKDKIVYSYDRLEGIIGKKIGNWERNKYRI